MYNVANSPATPNSAEDTGQMPAVLFGDAPAPEVQERPAGPDFAKIQGSEEFGALRSKFRRFVFPMSLLFFAWYLTYVLLAAYAHDFMSVKVFGSINIGIILGILQFVSTIAIMVAYLRFAKRTIDPQVAEIRLQAGVQDR